MLKTYLISHVYRLATVNKLQNVDVIKNLSLEEKMSRNDQVKSYLLETNYKQMQKIVEE